MSGEVLVIGGDIQSVQTALDLADCGIKVTLVEQSPALQANAPAANESGGNAESLRLTPKFLRAANHPNINILTNSAITTVKGTRGNFRVTISQQPRYVNPDICATCARCEQECPVNIISPDGETGNGHKAIHLPGNGLKSVPSTYIIDKNGVSPCTAACPAGINVQGYVALLSKGKVDEALDLITESVAFPRVLGRVCTHPCEDACTRGKIDKPVSICALKRFAADHSSPQASLKRTQESDNNERLTGRPRVAIIGSGPAGLTAARDLARFGHRSTVFEALPVPGGMISVGMPRFRLPREVRQADIEDIVRLGIEIRTSTPISKDFTIQDLRYQGYEAILIAVGAHRNQRLGIPGEGLDGVINSITFLQAFNLKQPVTVGKKVVVIGGGYTGIDSARTAVRLHCERVLVVDRFSKGMLTANPEEVTEAEEEGVEFNYLVAPMRIIGRDGKVAGIEFRRMRLGRPDAQGRRNAIPIEGSDFFVEADTVVVSTGQRPDLSFLLGDTTLNEGRRHIIVNPLTLMTKIPGIFAAGDATRPGAPMINAIAEGRQAAVSIDRFLRGKNLTAGRSMDKIKPVELNLDEIRTPPIGRQPMPRLLHEFRVGNFEEVDLGYTPDMAVKEAKRCLNCAGCSMCLECVRACELEAINHNMLVNQTELEIESIAIRETQNAQLWNAEGIDLTTRHSGVYWIPSSPGGELSPGSATASNIMVDLAQMPALEREKPASQDTSKRDISKPSPSDESRSAPSTEAPRAGIFICNCGGSIGEVIDIPGVVEYFQGLDGIVLSQQVEYACNDETDRGIEDLAHRHNLTHVVLAACSCCNLDQICFSCSDRRVQCKTNLLGGYQSDNTYYEFVNIREHCAWVHKSNGEAATAKAKTLIRAGLARALEAQPLIKKDINVERSTLVVGGGISGLRAAADLATQGFQTILINYPPNRKLPWQSEMVRQRLERELASQGATILGDAELTDLTSSAGKYRASITRKGKPQQFTAGAIILDLSASINGQNGNALTGEAKLPPPLLQAIGNGDKPPAAGQSGMEPIISQLPGVFVCGNGQETMNTAEALTQGSAAASKAAVRLRKGTADVAQTIAIIDQSRCRGCGTCETVCGFGAITLTERLPGVINAQVDEALCHGCGMCVAHCPSGALTQNGYSDRQIATSLEAILA